VGRIRIRAEGLLKRTQLTDEEFLNMKSHALYGKMLLEKLEDKVPSQKFLEYAIVLAHRHHERWDGTGYPDGLRGDEIPLQARMMSIADVYDALVSDRPYKKAYTHDQAIQLIIEGSGSQFDPNLTDLFTSLSSKIRIISEAVV